MTIQNKDGVGDSFWEWDGKVLLATSIILPLLGWFLLHGAYVEKLRMQEERIQIQKAVP